MVLLGLILTIKPLLKLSPRTQHDSVISSDIGDHPKLLSRNQRQGLELARMAVKSDVLVD